MLESASAGGFWPTVCQVSSHKRGDGDALLAYLDTAVKDASHADLPADRVEVSDGRAVSGSHIVHVQLH